LATESHYIVYHRSRIHYLRIGSGTEWLFCFHGYGETAESFKLLEPALGQRFTIIAIDMPFHGQTDWQEGLLFTPEELLILIGQIKPTQQSMHLLGYSMGGRIAMQLLQLIPEQITRLVLVAPDGLHKNKWQWIATRTDVGNRLFHYFMLHPKAVLGLMDTGFAIGLYNKSLHKFVHYYLDDADQRLTLYRRWTTMRKFRPDKDLLQSVIIKNKIPVRLLFGKHDHVILTEHGIDFAKNSDGFIEVTEIEAGHQLLKEKHLAQIVRLVSDQN
jgi:pimeloyl-ACP methyl ester carboxylesterase